MWKVVQELLPIVLVLLVITQYVIPVVFNFKTWWLFRSSKKEANSSPLEAQLKETKAEVDKTKAKVENVRTKVEENLKSAEDLKKDADKLI